MNTRSRASLLACGALVAFGALFACQSSDGGAAAGGTDGGGPGGQGPDGAVALGCGESDAVPGDRDFTFEVGGKSRTYRLHLPTGYDSQQPTALVLNFHGYSSYATQQATFSEMSDTADREGFAVAYPDGTGAPRGWNAGACCGAAAEQDVDDVAFVAAILDHAATSMCLDPKRVFATGFSNGGFLSHRLACEMSDRIAAIGSVAGVMGIGECQPSRPVSVLQLHGTSDTVVPFEGSDNYGFPSAPDTVEGWRVRSGCGETSAPSFAEGDTACQAWSGCDGGASVELCVIEDGGHTWPGGQVPSFLGKTTQALEGSDYLWQFFSAHPM